MRPIAIRLFENPKYGTTHGAGLRRGAVYNATAEITDPYAKYLLDLESGAAWADHARTDEQLHIVQRFVDQVQQDQEVLWSWVKAFFQQQLLSHGKDQTEHAHSAPINHPVTEAVSLLLTNEGARMSRGEITRQCYLMTRSRAQGEISRFFNTTPVGKVDRLRVDEFMTHLSQQGVRASTIKAYLVVLRKVLTVALNQGWIERLTAFPKIKTQTTPGGISRSRSTSRC